jgi:hypothetical protein
MLYTKGNIMIEYNKGDKLLLLGEDGIRYVNEVGDIIHDVILVTVNNQRFDIMSGKRIGYPGSIIGKIK